MPARGLSLNKGGNAQLWNTPRAGSVTAPGGGILPSLCTVLRTKSDSFMDREDVVIAVYGPCMLTQPPVPEGLVPACWAGSLQVGQGTAPRPQGVLRCWTGTAGAGLGF